MRNKEEQARARRSLQHARYEVLPTASTEEKVLAHVPVDLPVTVTASPSKGLDITFDLAERLAKAGYATVPHLAARMVSGRAELAEICDRLTGAGITPIFVPAVMPTPSAPTPTRSPSSKTSGSSAPRSPRRHHRLPRVAPEHPRRPTVQSMWDKRRHATHIVSNLTFDPKVFATWLSRMRSRGVTLPLLVGLPGPSTAKLLGMATKIGVGESTRFLAKNKRLFAGLAAPGGFTGERFLSRSPRASRHRTRWSRACTSSRSTRSPRPRPGARR